MWVAVFSVLGDKFIAAPNRRSDLWVELPWIDARINKSAHLAGDRRPFAAGTRAVFLIHEIQERFDDI